MKRYLLHSLIMLCLLGTSAQVGIAQEQKIGYVDTDYILSQMPGYEGAQQKLSSISTEWKSTLADMQQEIEQLKEDYQAKEILYTDELKEEKKREIQDKIEQRREYRKQKFGADGEYFQKQKELLKPIQRKVFEAINVVAKKQNFDFIFDRAQDSNMLYGVEEWNLNEEILQELGVTLDNISN